MSFTLSPNMNLPVPTVGNEPGPNYAVDVNSSLSLVDSHDHSPGKGVQITPNGLNINSALSMQNNFLTQNAGVTFSAQSSTPALNTIYEAGVDLFYVDGNGNNIRITQSGGIAGSPGSISNLTPPASASYVSGLSTFVWESGTSIAANMDFGAAILRNLSPNSTFGLTLQPPASLASNYTITLPTLPGSLSFVSIDNSGNMSASPSQSGGLTGGMIAAGTITGSNIAATTIDASKIVLATLTTAQMSATAGIIPSQTDSLTSGNYVTSTSIANYSNSTTSFTTAGSVNPTILVSTRPCFVDFGSNDGSNIGDGTTKIVVSGSSAVLQIEQLNGLTVVGIPVFCTLGVGTYPASIISCILFPSAATFRLEAKMTGGGSIAITNTLMQVFQV